MDNDALYQNLETRLQRIEQILVIGTKNVLDTHEVATMLGVSADHVRHLVCQRAIPHYKKGRSTYFKKTEIEQWQLSRRVPTADEIHSKACTHVALNRKRI